ncbi:UDP-glycosyltransferase 92A1-like isoform X2 [Tasmannia lanceolata]|uniref:UDP-glycosyltransferase 92A1-like isoform X2 n=1 Tax=Tasmannia lanceolata TaxID=3420 RepID=UPI0040633CBF
MTEIEKHMVLFPYMAQGHLIPSMELARLLNRRTRCTITLVNTPLNIKKLRASLPSDNSIQLAELPFCSSDHGLPPDSENTDSLPFHHLIDLYEASQTLQPSFEQLLSKICEETDHSHVCIISDMFYGWTVEVANKLGIFHSFFISSGAYGTAVYFELWLHLPHSQTDSEEFLLPDFPKAGHIHRSQLPDHLKLADGTDRWSKFLRREFSFWGRSDGFLINTVEEFELIGLGYFRRKLSRPVWPIGPITSEKEASVRKNPGIPVDHCGEWLNLHRPCSVLYISFGSQNSISTSQMMALAMGLERSGKAFIWAIRAPIGFDKTDDFRSEWLPEGFEARVGERKQGILVRKWAPQLEILSHKSTGAFLSHCGWNSTVESLTRGVPMIGWPISGEQFYNSKMLEEEIGVCVEIGRGNSEEIREDHVVKVIEMVMGETEKGEEMRRRVYGVKEMLEAAIREDGSYKGSSIKALDEFLNTAFSTREKDE